MFSLKNKPAHQHFCLRAGVFFQNSPKIAPMSNASRPSQRNPWKWIPSLYFAEGLPYVIVMTLSVLMYKRLGISNTDIALYTSWLYLPWVIKPLWSPVVDLLRTKRFWIVSMQLLIGAGLACIAFTIPTDRFFQYTLAFFWLVAFSSATHDIAADGFYMIALREDQQAFFVGIRSTFYRLAMLTGQGLIVILAGYFEIVSGLPPVDIQITADPGLSQQAPGSLQLGRQALEKDSAQTALLAFPPKVVLSSQPIPAAVADSLRQVARSWNTARAFYSSEAREQNQGAEASWWSRHVSQPLGNFLKTHLGPQQQAAGSAAMVGNLAMVRLYLSRPPENNSKLVVNLDHYAGDKSFRLVEGSRLTFDQRNWEQGAYILVQLDPKLRQKSSATFRAVSGNISFAWMVTFLILAGLLLTAAIYHRFLLPYPTSDQQVARAAGEPVFKAFFDTFALFFRKKHIGVAILFLLLYRLGEAQLVKLAAPFLLDAKELGGLGLTTGEVGFVYGTVGLIALSLGGILGGLLASRHGLKHWLWWMLVAINLPNAVYIYLAYAQPDSFYLISSAVAVEQFGYGFGFTAYMLYMIYLAEGSHKTAHFAIATAFMALGMMIPGLWSGWLQEHIGYQHFFVWVLLATVPAFVVTAFLKIDPEFGKKKSA